MSRIRRPPPLLVAGVVVLGMALARYLGIPDWVAVLFLGGGSAVVYLVARMMGYSRDADSPPPTQDRLPGGPSEGRSR
ncbi:MAG: hypothetical protein OXI45_03090 [Acidobacteriota bacterium]|nr:hypothetical protein [Acidobacteriota bacterium]MXW70137.1 hypothetical protein [Acidobacteriota bacterium]MYE43024.1 hypothetical protein [Acidobacteriota bacterium]